MAEETIQQQQRRVMPKSELDLSLMTTDSVWGKDEVPVQLQSALKKYKNQLDKDGKTIFDKTGNPIVTEESLWSLLGFYTRDVRLANLSLWNGEFQYCQYFLDLAGDMLSEKLLEPFIICLRRVATVLELSQSKGGFLRRRINTFTSESTPLNSGEPPKKSLFGANNKGKGKGAY